MFWSRQNVNTHAALSLMAFQGAVLRKETFSAN
jgi:hypothetical protein